MNIEEMQAQRDADYETYKAEGRIWGIVPREKIARIRIPRTSKEVIDRYYALEDMSTAVSDILDTYGIHGAVPNTYLKPIKAGSRLVGTAVTVRSIPFRKTATQGQCDKDKILMSTKDISIWVRRAMCWCRISEAIWSIPISVARAAIWRKYVDLQAASLMEAAAIRRRSAGWISRYSPAA